ncbi:hypothetical protein LV779_12640 [Streptomyces thinghirensis]|nr:hypothetical protein [Streptomyces thinghirensis]
MTAPGRKECEGGTDSRGRRPAAHRCPIRTTPSPTSGRTWFEPQVSATDSAPGRAVWPSPPGAAATARGRGLPAEQRHRRHRAGRVTAKKVASGLKEPMGIKHVDGKLYVSQKHELTDLNDTDGDEVTDQYRRGGNLAVRRQLPRVRRRLLYQDGFFYLNLSVSINYGGATTDPVARRGPRYHQQGEQGHGRGLLRRRRTAHPERHRLRARGRPLRLPTT